MDSPNSLAKQLQLKRRELKLTQGELADQLGCSQEMVSMVESGAKKIPSTMMGKVRQFILSGKVSRTLAE